MSTTPALSRRQLAQVLGAGLASAALRPGWSNASPLLHLVGGAEEAAAAGLVRLNSNENPYGPSPAAVEAMRDAFSLVWRYPDEHADALLEELAKLHGVGIDHILLGNGSGDILKLAASAFTGPGRSAVVADPTFEAIGRHAQANQAEVVRVPLTADHRHDLTKMLTAASGPGLFYVCNPNNPTASLTPKGEVRAFLAKAPREALVLVDEAYFHYADSREYESAVPLVREHPNLVAVRTFSKIYGMAGLRCGYAVAQPATLERLRVHQPWDNLNIMALAAAKAGLKDVDHVERSRRLNRETKGFVCAELEAMGYRFIPSETNFLMIDLNREAGPVVEALRQRKVHVGRRFPALPNFLRVTIGTRPEMQAFLAAFRQARA